MKKVQRLVEAMEILRATLMQPPPKKNQMIMNTKWETFE